MQEPDNHHPEQEESKEALGSLSDYESENENDIEPENEMLDDEAMIHMYCSEWIDDLHRDDLVSYSSFASPPGNHATLSIDKDISADCRIDWRE